MTTCADALGAAPSPSTTEAGADATLDEDGHELADTHIREGLELASDPGADRLARNRRVDTTDEVVGELVDPVALLGSVLGSHP
jgi:hypothetical protein